jgi:hypothetical protein
MIHSPTHTSGSQDNYSHSSPESWTSVTLYAIAAIALGYALQIHDARNDLPAMLWLTAGVLATIGGLFIPRIGWLESSREHVVTVVVVAGLSFQLWNLLTATFLLSATASIVTIVLVALSFVIALMLSRSPLTRRVLLPLFLVIHFCLGVFVIRQTPAPAIDVYLFHKQAIDAVMHGINPHAGTIPNIYNNTNFYGPGIVQDGRVQIGFPYPPLSLLFSLAGYLMAGDHRYSILAAVFITAALLAYLRFGIMGVFAALIFLTTPRIFYLIELGWSDPFVVLLLVVTVFVACRKSKLLPWALGLLLAIKQYTVFVLPFSLFLLPQPVDWREFERMMLKAIVLAALLTLPMLLWNPHGFLRDVILFQFRQPFRLDSLSYLAWMSRDYGIHLPTSTAFVLLGPTIAIALWKAPRTPAGFTSAVAFVYLLFFAFSKQAFANYYFFVIGALSCAIAATTPRQYVINASPRFEKVSQKNTKKQHSSLSKPLDSHLNSS